MLGQEAAVAADRVVDFEAVLAAQYEVVLAVSGCRVHGAGAGFEGDVVADHQQRFARIKRVLQFQAFECRAFAARNNVDCSMP